jgi:Arc/MetJ-type ribon-helix-helix transcriptional regulator
MQPSSARKVDEKADLARLDAIRAAVLAGEKSGVAEGDVIEEIRERMRKRALAGPLPRMRNLKI